MPIARAEPDGVRVTFQSAAHPACVSLHGLSDRTIAPQRRPGNAETQLEFPTRRAPSQDIQVLTRLQAEQLKCKCGTPDDPYKLKCPQERNHSREGPAELFEAGGN